MPAVKYFLYTYVSNAEACIPLSGSLCYYLRLTGLLFAQQLSYSF